MLAFEPLLLLRISLVLAAASKSMLPVAFKMLRWQTLRCDEPQRLRSIAIEFIGKVVAHRLLQLVPHDDLVDFW